MLEPARRALVGQVVALFNDAAKGERPIERSAEALIPPGSVAWRVHGDVATMMIGGIAALLLHMLHPLALAGVWDHSNFRRDLIGRLRRTARFIAITTYGARGDAEAAIARVRAIHARVAGVTPTGEAYRADDAALLAWVHVAGAIMFLDSCRRYGEPLMSRADQDAYFADVAPIARLLGADPVPVTRAEAEALVEKFRGELTPSDRSREVARIITRHQPARLRDLPPQAVATQAAVDLLPPWARAMHGLDGSGLARPAIDLAAFGMASGLRWAFAGAR